jgi:hypothetical protein
MRHRAWPLLFVLSLSTGVRADGPADNIPEQVRQVPKPGIAVPDDIRRALQTEVDSLREEIATLATKPRPDIQAALPDIEIFAKAVSDALQYHEFFKPEELDTAKNLLAEARRRADHVLSGEGAPWTRQKGLVVRAYKSKIDGSVQPFGLVIPDSYTLEGPHRYRLDVWFHGRNEDLTELNFLDRRMKDAGQFSPRDTIVLHPYGRFCNAFKFAGEVDVMEAIDAVKRMYRIDEDRVSVRGFSMGGAATWHFAVHYATNWFAANPGAGFSETPKFLDVFQKEKLDPPWYEKTLWNLYDCDKWALNLNLVPTVAYSGENDIQKQAADVMAEELKIYGVELTHIIGPGMGHQYDPSSAHDVEARMDALAEFGRDRPSISRGFVTYALRYNHFGAFTIDALDEHWKRAEIAPGFPTFGGGIVTQNVRAFTIDLPAGSVAGGVQIAPDPLHNTLVSTIDGQLVDGAPPPRSDRSWRCSFHKEDGTWKLGPLPDGGLRKKHALQGPIDDAFLDSFVFVMPTSTSPNPKFQAWCEAERTRAVERWRRQFRGAAPQVKDTELTDTQIASSNLVLWGDPSSNAVLKKIADKLPIHWEAGAIVASDRRFPTADHALILIFPNPLNPAHYVVLNSGFTYREYDDLNNARQTPKLPDWAVIDLNTPPNSRWPGKVVAADFFDERWRLKRSEKGAIREPD